MVEQTSLSRRAFIACNYVFLITLSLVCILPLIYVAAVSLSSVESAAAGEVRFWPVGFNLKSFEYILSRNEFFDALGVTLKRIVIGVSLNMFFTITVAYPLSKDSRSFPKRTLYVWVFVFTMLFNAGLIPIYMTMRALGLLDTVWALVMHNSVPIFNVVILINFFRGLPKELEESAFVDGAGDWSILWKIFVPLSLPAVATLTLIALVYQWNAWFDGIIFMNSPQNYPLQSYLYTVVSGIDSVMANASETEFITEISNTTVKAAQILLGALPILLAYPFLQRYFVKGMTLGSVKE